MSWKEPKQWQPNSKQKNVIEFITIDDKKRSADELADEDAKRKQIKVYKPVMITKQLSIPAHMAPLVQGRGGEQLINIEMACNCTIKIGTFFIDAEEETVNDQKLVTIKGEELSVNEAKSRIEDIVHGSGALAVLMGGHSQPGSQTIYVQVPTSRGKSFIVT
jgi:hypothetical protein